MELMLSDDVIAPEQLRLFLVAAGVPSELVMAIEDNPPTNTVVIGICNYASEIDKYAKSLNEKLLSAKKRADEAVGRFENSDALAKRLRLDNDRQVVTIRELQRNFDGKMSEIEALKKKAEEANQTLISSENSKKQEIDSLKNANVLAKSRVKSFHKREKDLQLALREVREANERLSKQLDAKFSEITAKEAEFARFSNEIDELKKEVSRKEADLTKSSKRCEDLKVELEEANSEIRRIRTELEAEREKVKAMVKESGGKLELAKSEAEKIQKRNIDLSNEVARLNEESVKLRDDLTKRSEKLKKMEIAESLKGQVKVGLEHKDAEISALRLSESKLKSEIESLKNELETVKKAVDPGLRKRYEETKKWYWDSEKDNKQLRMDNERLQLNLQKMGRDLAELRKEIKNNVNSMSSPVETLSPPLPKIPPPPPQPPVDNRDEEVAKFENALKHVSDLLHQVKGQLHEKSNDLDASLGKLQEVEAKLAEKTSELERIQKINSQNWTELLLRNDKLKELTTQLAEANEKADRFASLSSQNWKKLLAKEAEISRVESLAKSNELLTEEVKQLKQQQQVSSQIWQKRLANQQRRGERILVRRRHDLIRGKIAAKRELFKMRRRQKGGISQLALGKSINDRRKKLIDWLKATLATKTKQIADLEQNLNAKENQLASAISSQISNLTQGSGVVPLANLLSPNQVRPPVKQMPVSPSSSVASSSSAKISLKLAKRPADPLPRSPLFEQSPAKTDDRQASAAATFRSRQQLAQSKSHFRK